MRFHEQGPRKRDAHSPPTTHILRRPLHHRLAEAQTMQDAPRLCLERVRIQLLHLLVRGVERELVHFVRDAELFDALLQFRDLLLR